jgi:hypothetical protein
MASLKVNSGPPLRPWKRCPLSVKSTVNTMPAGPAGVSAGERQILSTWLSGSSDTQKFAASSALPPSNQRQG